MVPLKIIKTPIVNIKGVIIDLKFKDTLKGASITYSSLISYRENTVTNRYNRIHISYCKNDLQFGYLTLYKMSGLKIQILNTKDSPIIHG